MHFLLEIGNTSQIFCKGTFNNVMHNIFQQVNIVEIYCNIKIVQKYLKFCYLFTIWEKYLQICIKRSRF